MVKVLVTGVNGFVGKHLANELSSRGVDVIGTGMDPTPRADVKHSLISYITCDLTNIEQVGKLPLGEVSGVINLAGLAKMGDSFAKPELYMRVNVDVLSVLSERLLKIKSSVRVVAVSSGAVYKNSQPMPLLEKSALLTEGSPYTLSKIAMEKEALRLRVSGLNCVIVRPFNHIGPGQEGGFLVPDLYQKIMQAKKNGGPIRVGNLATRRDYTDVRDVVKGYADLATTESLENDIYNICSGRARSGNEILELMLAKLDAKDIEVEVDQSLIRPTDPKEIYGSYSRLHNETGWEPVAPFEQTITDFIAWRQAIDFKQTIADYVASKSD